MPAKLLQFTLPDLLAMCPWKGSTNPHYETAGPESTAWISSHQEVLTDRKRAFFAVGANELLVSHTYPYAGYEQFRTVCDFVNLLFIVDEISDDQSGEDARATGATFTNAMSSDWDDCSGLAKVTKEFRARFLRLAGPNSARRFLGHCKDYSDAVSREADLRAEGTVLGLEPYITLRRENSAVRLCFGLIESVLGIDLPDEVFEDPTFMDIYWAGVDSVCWSNDLYSYKMERAKGLDGNNIVTVLMQEQKMDLQAAADYIGVYFKGLADRYLQGKSKLPSWGPVVDEGVARYVEGVGHWIKGNLDWSFESQRYFGPEHWEIKTNLLVTLQPREEPQDESDLESD